MTKTRTIRNMLIIAGVFLCGVAPAAELAPKPEVAVGKCDKPPVIDGKLDDACWKNSTKLEAFNIYKDMGEKVADMKKTTGDTTVLITTDDKWLYIAFVCKNEHMRFLNQVCCEPDDRNIIMDDSVELFLSREDLSRYYHFILSFANVRADRKIRKSGSVDHGWSFPWVSAVDKDEKGWTAEIAIPLSLINSTGSGEVTANLLRNKINVELDNMGARLTENKEFQLWAPITRSAHDPEAFGIIKGFKGLKAGEVFLPFIEKAGVDHFNISGDRFSFDVNINVRNVTTRGGTIVLDAFGQGAGGAAGAVAKKIFSRELALPSFANTNLKVNVPVQDFAGQRLTALTVTDKDSGMKMQEYPLAFSGDLLVKVIPELNYYTGEKTVRIKYISPLTLAGMFLKIYGPDNTVIGKGDGLNPEAEFPVARLKEGQNKFKAELCRADGRVLDSKMLTVKKLPPKKDGSETKVDHFRRIVLRNGRPFFPFGMYLCSDIDACVYADKKDESFKRDVYKRIVRTGMNTVTIFYDISGAYIPWRKADWRDADLRIKDAQEAGLQVGYWEFLLMARNPPAGKRFANLEEGKTYATNFYAAKILPDLTKLIANIKSYPNFLFYYGFDEPNLGDYQLNLFVQKLYYETVRELDPYHVMFGLYARSIPSVPEAVDYFDVLGYDVYTYPNWDRFESKVCDHMAVMIAQLDKRAAERDMPIWAVPMPNTLDSNRTPRFLSKQEQFCQAYVAIIYGAKGLMYFNYDCALGKEAWEALETLGKQIKSLEPAIMNYPVQQVVTYAPGEFVPEKEVCPDAHARLFKFPDDDYLLLAVNGRNYPVDVTFSLDGLKKAKPMFGQSAAGKVRDAAFSDSLEAYGVRAYKLKIEATASGKVVKLGVNIKSYPEQEQKIPSNEQLIEQAARRKNHILNPSFEMPMKVHGMPDFYYPYRILDVDQFAEKGSHWFLDTDNPKFGQYALRMHRYPFTETLKGMRAGVFAQFSLPPDAKDIYTFSFYARAAKEGQGLWTSIFDGTKKENVKEFKLLTTSWERYCFTTELIGDRYAHRILIQPLHGDEIIWIDGLQLEKGNVATEFSEN